MEYLKLGGLPSVLMKGMWQPFGKILESEQGGHSPLLDNDYVTGIGSCVILVCPCICNLHMHSFSSSFIIHLVNISFNLHKELENNFTPGKLKFKAVK